MTVSRPSHIPPKSASTWQPPDRAQWLDLPVRRAAGVHVGHVRGRTWLHNPYGYNALAVVSPAAFALWQAADGRPLRAVLQDLPEGQRGPAERDLPLLWRNGLLLSPDVHMQRPEGKPERVFNAWLHLTNACNLACPYCYIHKSSDHMEGHVSDRTLAAIEATAQAGEVDRIHVRFAGGEPMLQFAQLQAFYLAARERCQRHGVKFSAAVLTNGTVVPSGAPEWLRDNAVSVSVSVDGVGETQDTMRPVKGGGASSERLQAGMRAYLAAGIRPYMLVTVGDSNLDGLPDLVDWLMTEDLGFRLSLVRDLEWGAGTLDDRHGAELATSGEVPPVPLLSGEPLFRVQRKLAEAYGRVEAHLLAQPRRRTSFRATHKFCDLELWRPIEQACGAGRSYVAISEKGEVSPCQAALHHPGTQAVSPTSLLHQARAQTQFQPFRRHVLNAECAACQFRSSCAGGCPLLLFRREGHVDGRSPYCEVFRAVIPQILRLSALEMILAGE